MSVSKKCFKRRGQKTKVYISLRRWRDFAGECFCFGSEAVRRLVKGRDFARVLFSWKRSREREWRSPERIGKESS